MISAPVVSVFLVFVGGGIGAVLRHGASEIIARLSGASFPWGTLTVNVVGSFAMGMLAAWLALRAGAAWSGNARLFLATGVLGGFTTFSAFSLDAVTLWQGGAPLFAALYVAGSVMLSVAALFAGLWLVMAAG